MTILQPAFDLAFAQALSSLRARGELADLVDGVYADDLLGFGLVLPDGWSVRDRRVVERVREGRLVSSEGELLNEVFRSLAEEYAPLVVLAAPPVDDPVARLGPHELAPCLTVHSEPKPAEPAHYVLWEHVQQDLAAFHGYLEDFHLLEGPFKASVSGYPAVQYRARYTTLHADAVGGCPTREMTVYVHREPHVLAVRGCDYPERDIRLSQDFAPLFASLRMR